MHRRFLVGTVFLVAYVFWGGIQPGFGQDSAKRDAGRLDAVQTAEKEMAIRGSFAGIGAGLKEANGSIVVLNVVPGAPAERAGLRPGSEVLSINGIATQGMKLMDAVKLIRGPAGSTLSMDIRTPAGATTHLELTREKVVVGKPQAAMLRPAVGMLKLTLFGGETVTEVGNALRQLQSQGAKALILDLRGCGGGELRAMADVSSLFLPKDSALWLSENSQTGERKLQRSTVPGEFLDLPLVVLVNRETHGELPAAAIQRNARGAVIGQTTSGLSAAKSLVKNPDGTSQVVPVGTFLMAPGKPITDVGVVPDIVVPEKASEEEFIGAALAQIEKSAGSRAK